MHLDIIGELEDLAPGESIYSARFMGERCYLVTFKKIDPLFVIDLHDPYSPKVLGELKITGYSDYLHPYDEDHVIGIGKEAVAATEGDFAWYQGVKISLFDVSDVAHPEEIAKYEIGDRGTDSAVLRDHKAFLFDRERELLVLPVLLAEIDESQYPYGVPDHAYGEFVWQGAYVFSLSLEDGLQLRGRITHYDSDDDLSQEGYYYFSPESVQRSLYIDDALYTISEAKIKVNDLETLDEIAEVQLS
jgi:inhibitor of cysteine peptidase